MKGRETMAITAESSRAALGTIDIAPGLLASWIAAGEASIIDVREDYEHAEERIGGSASHPLSSFDPEAIRRGAGEKRVVFQCRTGRRSLEAAKRYRRGDEPVFHLAGGLEAWKAAGHSVIRPEKAPRLPIMRQVQIVAGALVALGVLLGVTVSAWFLAVAGFVGCGLMFAGLSGWCGMAELLAIMPWNKGLRRAGRSASCSVA